jgi:hypothetical protein
VGKEEATPGNTNWSADEIKRSPAVGGTDPKERTVFLADIVGSRTITVQAKAGVEESKEVDLTFGDGPLSVFAKTSTGGMAWSLANQSDNNQPPVNPYSFQYSGNSFPAAEFCSGPGTIDRAVRTDTSPRAGFEPWDSASAYWSLAQVTRSVFSSSYSDVRRAVQSKLPKAEQLLAVSAYSTSYNGSVQSKGAAFAAGWPLDNLTIAWTGEALFASDTFNAVFVRFADGFVYLNPVQGTDYLVTVCVRAITP